MEFKTEIGECQEFMTADGHQESVSIVIAPLKVISSGPLLKVISGCNMWTGCFNDRCFYSLASRNIIKAQSESGLD